MKQLPTILLLAVCLIPAAAQEVSPELRRDISELISLRAADSFRGVSEALGKAFVPEIYREQFRTILQSGKAVEEPKTTDCPMAAAHASGILKQFEPRDFDTQLVLERMEFHLTEAPPEDEEKALKERIQFSEKVGDAYRPVLRARERAKEDEILRGNATREGVITLEFGVQMETEAGEDDIRSINRGTTETGVAFYTRTTRRMEWSDLPEAIRLQADKLPKARSWTFWVPADAAARVEEFNRKQAENENNRRAELMQKLMGAHGGVGGVVSSGKKKKAAHRRPQLPDEEPVMQKIKVWKDNPDAPVETQPDVVSDMI